MPPAENTLSSTANPVIRQIRALEQKKGRDETGLFLVDGQRYVTEALLAGWLPAIVLATPRLRNDATLRRQLAGQKAQRHEVTPELMARITGRDNAGDLLVAFQQNYSALAAVNRGLWVGLEEIRDPGNLGTIIRTAEAAGAAGVLLIGNCCDVWSGEVIRASAGAFCRVKIARATQAEFGKWTKSYEGQVIGTMMNAPLDYRKTKYKPDALLLMGSEHAGLSPALMASCTASVKIPMKGQIESLNVAIATALLLFEMGQK